MQGELGDSEAGKGLSPPLNVNSTGVSQACQVDYLTSLTHLKLFLGLGRMLGLGWGLFLALPICTIFINQNPSEEATLNTVPFLFFGI